MTIRITLAEKSYTIDGFNPIDLSLSIGLGGENPNAFFINSADFQPIRVGDFVGSVKEGGSANCEILTLCAHGNGTHTECVGHISENRISLQQVWTPGFNLAQLVTVTPNNQGEVTLAMLEVLDWETAADAVIFRSLPNEIAKRSFNWSGIGAPYFEPSALQFLAEKGFQHLLTDFPSVDPEEDHGQLEAHHAWWGIPFRSQGVFRRVITSDAPRFSAAITELIYVPTEVLDGLYVLQIMVPNLMTDAVPSRPLLYPIIP